AASTRWTTSRTCSVACRRPPSTASANLRRRTGSLPRPTPADGTAHTVVRIEGGPGPSSRCTSLTAYEVDVVGEIVQARPLERPVRAPARAHRLERRAVGPDLGVARHAGLRRRDARHRGGLDRGVAVAAVDPDSADVVLVAE